MPRPVLNIGLVNGNQKENKCLEKEANQDH